MASNNAKITPAQREAMLELYLAGRVDEAEAMARALRLADNYVWKLARARGVAPRTAKRWDMRLREIALISAVLMIGMVHALAHFHDHQELNAWVSDLHNRNGILCCSLEDGVLLSEPDWDRQYDKQDSHFRVRIEGEWIDVPDEKLVDGPNRADHALIWIVHQDGKPVVRCFMPGTLT